MPDAVHCCSRFVFLLVKYYHISWSKQHAPLFDIHHILRFHCGMKTIGQNIAACRERAGLTQTQLQAACGWGEGNGRINNYEKGRRKPDIDDLLVIANALSVTRTALLGDDDSVMSGTASGVVACGSRANAQGPKKKKPRSAPTPEAVMDGRVEGLLSASLCITRWQAKACRPAPPYHQRRLLHPRIAEAVRRLALFGAPRCRSLSCYTVYVYLEIYHAQNTSHKNMRALL